MFRCSKVLSTTTTIAALSSSAKSSSLGCCSTALLAAAPLLSSSTNSTCCWRTNLATSGTVHSQVRSFSTAGDNRNSKDTAGVRNLISSSSSYSSIDLAVGQQRSFWSSSSTTSTSPPSSPDEQRGAKVSESDTTASAAKVEVQTDDSGSSNTKIKIDLNVEKKEEGVSTASGSWTETVTSAATGAASSVASGAASVAGSAASTVASGAVNAASSAASSVSSTVSSTAGSAASSVASAAQAQAEATIKKGATGDLPSVVGSMMMGLGFSKGYLMYGAAMTLLRSRMARSGAWSIVKFFGRQLISHPYFTGTCVSGGVIFYWIAAPIAAVVSGAVCVAIVGLFLLPRGVSSWIFSILGNSFLAASSATAATPATGAAGGVAALPLASYLNTVFWFGIIAVATIATLKCKDLYEENQRLKEKIQLMEEHKSFKM